MHEGLHSLTGRELEVLRLLLAGHDAKSAARQLELSVHTVNDRLRDARRKLGVSSSREAARLLAEAEHKNPHFLAPKKVGVPGTGQAASLADGSWDGAHFLAHTRMGVAGGASLADSEQPVRRQGLRSPLAWLVGGMIVMSMMIAALLPSSPFRGAGGVPAPAAGQAVLDLMPIADTDKSGHVTAAEYAAFSRQGWGFVSRGNEQVTWAELDPMARVSLLGIAPNADGVITRQMYFDAIPARFRMLDRNGDGTLSSDEINGRGFQS